MAQMDPKMDPKMDPLGHPYIDQEAEYGQIRGPKTGSKTAHFGGIPAGIPRSTALDHLDQPIRDHHDLGSGQGFGQLINSSSTRYPAHIQLYIRIHMC
jgi:hypothetical protein